MEAATTNPTTTSITPTPITSTTTSPTRNPTTTANSTMSSLIHPRDHFHPCWIHCQYHRHHLQQGMFEQQHTTAVLVVVNHVDDVDDNDFTGSSNICGSSR
mmetsp:Transcript_19444/g.21444  ORF Transcript_19444/g.21444 Transcript_19444/m.21444 type:complete len:101 (+) Transcript_19444:401-703(+)